MTFYVGQKVVCISSGWKKDLSDPWAFGVDTFPVKNGIYTVRSVTLEYDDMLYLRLEEIRNKSHEFIDGNQERRFGAIGFRPLVETKTDISVFTEMLTKTVVDIDATDDINKRENA